MPTERLYHHDDYLESFEATLLEIDREASSLVLDQTAFYPTGGHQQCDHGRIAKNRSSFVVVIDVSGDEDGRVRHQFAAARGELKPGDRVTGSIDWKRRYHHMRLHTVQHIFSHWAEERLGLATGRASFSPEGGSVVMSRPLSWEELFLLEADVNRVVSEARDVVRTIDDDGVVTITVDGLTASPCGGTHVRSTDEIGLFKIASVDGKSLHYEVGQRARRVAVRLANAALRSSEELNAGDPSQLDQAAREVASAAAAAAEEARRWRRRLTRAQIDAARRNAVALDEATILFELDLSHLPSKRVQNMLKQDLAGDDEVWICLADRGTLLIASGSDAVDAGALLERLREIWELRGAGGPGLAQGGPVPEEIDDPIAAVRRLVGLGGRARPTAAGRSG